jgi:hypothetical protein
MSTSREVLLPYGMLDGRLVSVDDISISGIKRYSVKARVDKVLTSEELQSVSRSILKELTLMKTVQ